MVRLLPGKHVMASRRFTAFLLLSFLLPQAISAADDWKQFRGPNGSGVSGETNLPVDFGPEKNVIWKTPLPPGHSSPVLAGDRIFVSAHEGEMKLLVLSLDRAGGKIVWRREILKPRAQKLHKSNSPASPSPVTDGRNVYAFFTQPTFGMFALLVNLRQGRDGLHNADGLCYRFGEFWLSRSTFG